MATLIFVCATRLPTPLLAASCIMAIMFSGCRPRIVPVATYDYEVPLKCGFLICGTRNHSAYLIDAEQPWESLVPSGSDLFNAPANLAPGVDGVIEQEEEIYLRCTLIRKDGTVSSISYYIINTNTCILQRATQEDLPRINNLSSWIRPWDLQGVKIAPEED